LIEGGQVLAKLNQSVNSNCLVGLALTHGGANIDPE